MHLITSYSNLFPLNFTKIFKFVRSCSKVSEIFFNLALFNLGFVIPRQNYIPIQMHFSRQN